MNYNIVKKAYQLIFVLILILSITYFFLKDTITGFLNNKQLLIISASLCIPFFILKIIHESKHPPSQRSKYIGYSFLFIVILFFMYNLFKMI